MASDITKALRSSKTGLCSTSISPAMARLRTALLQAKLSSAQASQPSPAPSPAPAPAATGRPRIMHTRCATGGSDTISSQPPRNSSATCSTHGSALMASLPCPRPLPRCTHALCLRPLPRCTHAPKLKAWACGASANGQLHETALTLGAWACGASAHTVRLQETALTHEAWA